MGHKIACGEYGPFENLFKEQLHKIYGGLIVFATMSHIEQVC